jgi:hypothetical protein
MVGAQCGCFTRHTSNVSPAHRMAAIRFLTLTGQRSDDRREEFILLSGDATHDVSRATTT